MIRRVSLSALLFVLFCATSVVGQTSPKLSALKLSNVPEVNGLYVSCPEGMEKFPVLIYRGLAFVAYSHADNRMGMTIVGYDQYQNAKVRINKEGARYLKEIKIDHQRRVAQFIGQGGREIVIPWTRLTTKATKPVGINRSKSRRKSRRKSSTVRDAKDVDRTLRELEKMKAEWEASEKEIRQGSKDAEAAIRKEREGIVELLKLPTIDEELAMQLTAMAALLDVGVMTQAFGDAFTGGDTGEYEKELKINTKIIKRIRAKVASKAFTGSKSEQKKLLKQIDQLLKKRNESMEKVR